MESDFEVLIGVQVTMEKGHELLQKIAEKLKAMGEVVSSSSIYQVSKIEENWRQKGDEAVVLAVCFLCRSEQRPIEALQTIKNLENDENQEASRKVIHIYLLAYGKNVAMSKALNLPHPELHADPSLLMPAKEVLPEFVHPVLHRTLSDLSLSYIDEPWGKFYAQGNTVL